MNINSFMYKFSDDKKSRQYIESLIWDGCPVCPFCKSEIWYKLSSSVGQYKCGNRKCHKKYSVTVGTFIHQSHLPLNYWLITIYLFCSKNGVTSHQLSRDLGITQKSSWIMLKKIRKNINKKPCK